jgi:hypothetical protein
MTQAQMLQSIQQTMANMHQGQGYQQAPQPHPRDKVGKFQRTKHQQSHTRLSQWMPMTGLKPLKRNFKLCSATTERWFCLPHTSSRDLHPTSGMHMLVHMRSPAA